MTKALVLGVNGQDGSFAAEALLRRGYQVIGAGRQEVSRYVANADEFGYRQLDVADQNALLSLLTMEQPDVVFHVAAIHGAAGFSYEAVFADMMAVNVVSVQTVLEYARTSWPKLKLIYANSAKIFPNPLVGHINENTTVRPTCLYSIGKIAALELIRFYRQRYNVWAANLILFNHESARRPQDYFLSIVAVGLARALADHKHRFAVKTLDFWVDWSSAEELMDIAIDISERAVGDDFVLASGRTWHARQVVADWFARHGLNVSSHVAETLPAQPLGPTFTVELDRLHASIGRRPERTVQSIADELLQAARQH